jgi:hypothetical protein
LTAGDVFYMPPGHTAILVEDLRILDFSPEESFVHLMDHIHQKIEEMSAQE